MERCPICGTEAGRTLPYKGAAQEALRFHAIALCQQCEAGFALPRPDQPTLDRFYASGSYWHAASGRAQRAHEASQAWFRVRRVRSYLGNNVAVADIGAGHGGIARAFAGMGIGVSRYVFVEPDPQAAADIAALSLPFSVARAASVSGLLGPFDVVFLNHVLEHVANPLGLLMQVSALVSPGGIVYVETPHADYRFKDDVFPHVLFFTPKALRVLGEQLEVRTLACETFGTMPAPKHTPLGLVQRLAARALPLAASAPVQRLLDRVVWRYARRDDGIWLRWIFSGMKAR